MCVHLGTRRSQVSLGNALLAKFHFGGTEPRKVAQLRGNVRSQVKLGNEENSGTRSPKLDALSIAPHTNTGAHERLDTVLPYSDSARQPMTNQFSMQSPMPTAPAMWLIAFARGENVVGIFVNAKRNGHP